MALSDEHKAKMAAGREAARAARATAQAPQGDDFFEEGEAGGQDPMAALFADPNFAARLSAFVETAAEARVRELLAKRPAVTAASAPTTPTGEMGQLARAFEDMLQLQAMQMPGYFKPLPSEEVHRRAAGRVEMFALLKASKAAGTPPQYWVGPNKFYAGAIQYEEGDPVATYLPPVEDFTPCYDGPQGRVGGSLAQQVLDAMMQWLGGPSPDIATRVREAEESAHNLGMPLVGEAAAPVGGPVERLDVERRETVIRTPFPNVETKGPGIHGMHTPQARVGPRAQQSQPARGPAMVEGTV